WINRRKDFDVPWLLVYTPPEGDRYYAEESAGAAAGFGEVLAVVFSVLSPVALYKFLKLLIEWQALATSRKIPIKVGDFEAELQASWPAAAEQLVARVWEQAKQFEAFRTREEARQYRLYVHDQESGRWHIREWHGSDVTKPSDKP